jgi:hypothetical protein
VINSAAACQCGGAHDVGRLARARRAGDDEVGEGPLLFREPGRRFEGELVFDGALGGVTIVPRRSVSDMSS